MGPDAAVCRLLEGPRRRGAAVAGQKQGATPLYIACFNGHVDAARLLLENGAEVDRAMKDGAIPLWIACQKGPSTRRGCC